MTRDLREMDKLEAFLKENGIVYERIDEEDTFLKDGRKVIKALYKKHGYEYEPTDKHQIVAFDKDGKRTWDVICQRGSYGVEKGLLEGMGDIFNEAEGWLTAAEIIKRIEMQMRRADDSD